MRNASEEDINRSRLARGLAMATLLWVVCAVLGIPFKFALTLAFMAVGGMMLKEFAAGRASGGRVGGRGPHGGVKTTVRLLKAPARSAGCTWVYNPSCWGAHISLIQNSVDVQCSRGT